VDAIGDTNVSDANDGAGAGQLDVDAEIDGLVETLPTASRASTASV
jgi:hypothetical protein